MNSGMVKIAPAYWLRYGTRNRHTVGSGVEVSIWQRHSTLPHSLPLVMSAAGCGSCTTIRSDSIGSRGALASSMPR